MCTVHIYIEIDKKNIRPAVGYCGYVLEYESKKGLVTREGFTEVEGSVKTKYLTALINALSRMNKSCELVLHIPDESMVYCLTEQIKGWRQRDWCTAAGKELKDALLWRAVDTMLSKYRVSYDSAVHAYSEWMKSKINENIRKKDERKERAAN